MKPSLEVSTFGHIYQRALKSHLRRMGSMLALLRKTRREDIDTVAAAINIRPEILEKIENGEHDFRVRTFFAICDYYKVDLESVVGKGEVVHIYWE